MHSILPSCSKLVTGTPGTTSGRRCGKARARHAELNQDQPSGRGHALVQLETLGMNGHSAEEHATVQPLVPAAK
ncbi:hypothetical protein NDU88_002287 [Pleurodeles waltl]|uniref:Uncharacterized protein n=1 Tax=Pleurodeles waltl TaxID=8319 RepID=A0AAV7LBX1_PLEWA|nr:hypothetical protein NDU88_002287 [Pleurodeles waltl]